MPISITLIRKKVRSRASSNENTDIKEDVEGKETRNRNKKVRIAQGREVQTNPNKANVKETTEGALKRKGKEVHKHLTPAEENKVREFMERPIVNLI